MSWVDIGVNFTDQRLDFESVFTRALNANVTQMIITGTSVSSSQNACEMTAQHPSHLFSTAGVHPHHAKDFTAQTVTDLAAMANSKQVVAIGECGLDFNRNFSTPDQQCFAFEQQLKLACELGLPVFLHERDAFDAQIQLLKKYRSDLVGGVAHCFTGNLTQMSAYLELDLYIGVTAWVCDPKRGESLREAVKHLPLDRILLETDAPYLRPKGMTNNRKLDKGNNEPAYLPYIAAQVADLMGTDISSLQASAQYNTQTLFDFAGYSIAN
jgi:TatD DNase family protein